MKNLKMKLSILTVLLCVCLLCSAVLAEPGADDDPLISKSYVDSILIPKIQKMIDSKFSEVSVNGGSESADGAKFVVVEASEGDEIICTAGTELILRMGKATVIATQKGGLADTTSGYDLEDGKSMPSNHLLIVPVADGRGIKADTDIIVMIKGGYSVR